MNHDTISLLTHCSAGLRVSIGSVNDVLESVESPKLRQNLESYKQAHERLESQANAILSAQGLDPQVTDPMARGLSWVKTNVKLALKPNDHTVADLMVDRCHAGIKSLIRQQNQYPAADLPAKHIADALIQSNHALVNDLQSYL